MGNYYAKENLIEHIPPVTARSPHRNRNITSITTLVNAKPVKPSVSSIQKTESKVSISKKKSVEDLKKEKVRKDAAKELEITQKESLTKLRRKRRVSRASKCDRHNELELRKKPEEGNEIKKRLPLATDQQQQQKSGPNQPSKMEVKLISDIFKTVAELETTFIDEKKYERRLRSAFSSQIENMQHLEYSLHMEKERNKRLMELLNRYDCAEPIANYKDNGIQSNTNQSFFKAIETKTAQSNSDRSNWSFQRTFSNATDTPMSPMLMQQRYDELSRSCNTLQAELRRKDKMLTLAHCKQEALQAKCDRLTEQYLNAQRRIEDFQNQISMMHKKPCRRQKLSDSYDSEGSSVGASDVCHATVDKPDGNNRIAIEHLLYDDEAVRIAELEKYMMSESDRSLSKAKAE